MEPNPVVPTVEAVAVIIRRGDVILLQFNQKWGAFTFPMTKLRRWKDPNTPPAQREESLQDAAARAVAECLGLTITVEPQAIKDIRGYRQGDRDGTWKEYRFHVFEYAVDDAPESSANVVVEWLPEAEVLNENRQPISPTARDILRAIQ